MKLLIFINRQFFSVLFLLTLLYPSNECMAQEESSLPKREFRGTWITTLLNLDWPEKAGLSSSNQKESLQVLLDSLQALNLNAIIFQVRPSGDALYPTEYTPWTQWLSGRQGVAPSPYYDPLKFAIAETHQRAMEFHAWLNPFRADFNWNPDKELAPKHIYHHHPEWCLAYGKHLYLDPGIPEVREYVVNLVLDVVERYDVDAIHFDDYFYPYPVSGEFFPDSMSYALYGDTLLPLAEWRRGNIDKFILDLRDRMLEVRPDVHLGISPFGVWRNKRDDARGSETNAGITSYDHLHADILKWVEKGWIDYVIPQIYFSIGYQAVDFRILLDWWVDNQGNTLLYAGHALYKVANNQDPNWDQPNEIPDQISLQRRMWANGSAFFRAGFFQENLLGVTDSIRQNSFQKPVIPPLKLIPEESIPTPPTDFGILANAQGLSLIWELQDSISFNHRYGIYRSSGKRIPGTNPEDLYKVLPDTAGFFQDFDVKPFKKYQYLITTINRANEESNPTKIAGKRNWWGWLRKKSQ